MAASREMLKLKSQPWKVMTACDKMKVKIGPRQSSIPCKGPIAGTKMPLDIVEESLLATLGLIYGYLSWHRRSSLRDVGTKTMRHAIQCS